MAYPKYRELFEIYTDVLTCQLGAVIVQDGKPLAFFSCELSSVQMKYSVTGLELLSIVKCLNEFKSILWGQKLKVVTDHKNLVRDALGCTCDRVYRWRLLLEEYGPNIVYIAGTDNIVADDIIRLEHDDNINTRKNDVHIHMKALAKLFTSYVNKISTSGAFQTDNIYVHGTHTSGTITESSHTNCLCIHEVNENATESRKPKKMSDNREELKYLFASAIITDKDMIYPVTISEISEQQNESRLYKNISKINPSRVEIQT